MKVVVAGGSGLVGRHLVRELVSADHEAVVLTRDVRRTARRLHAGARAVAWDPGGQPGRWTEELANADAVVNLAGKSLGSWPWTAGRRRALVESRLSATSALVAALAALPQVHRPSVLVSASGTDTYERPDGVRATEETPPSDSFLARLCLDWEQAARRAEGLGVRVVLARFGLVVAPEAPALRRLVLPVRWFAGGPLGSGDQWISWVHVDDVVGLLIRAIERDSLSGLVNVVAPDPRPQAAFTRAIARLLGRPARLPTPAWLVRLVLGEQAVLALGSRHVWPARALADGYRFRHDRVEEALAEVLLRTAAPDRSDDRHGVSPAS